MKKSPKKSNEKITKTGKTILRQQYAMVKAIEDWLSELKDFKKP